MTYTDRLGHDYKRVTRASDDMMRMECACGKRSRWSVTYWPVMKAQDKHADEIARKGK